jgi:glutathione S-transferase
MAGAPLVIHTYPNNYRVNKAVIAARYNDIEVSTPTFEMGTANKTPEYLAKFPTGKVPAMETPFGGLFESGAIAKYIARLRPDTGLMGVNFFQQAQIEQWIDFCSFEIEVSRGAWIGQIFGYRPANQAIYEEAKVQINKALGVINAHLLNKTYLVGNQVTLADIVLITALQGLFEMVLTADVRNQFPNVMRWFDLCVHQKEFASVINEVKFCTEEKKIGEAKAVVVETKEADKPRSGSVANKKDEKPAENKEDGNKKGKGNKQSKKEENKPAETKPAEEKPAETANQNNAEGSGKKNKNKGNKNESGKKEEPKTDAPKEEPKKGKQQSKKDDKPAEDKPKEEAKRPESAKKQQQPKKDKEAGSETPRKDSNAPAPKTEEKAKKEQQPKKEKEATAETPKKEGGKQEGGKKESGKKEGGQQQGGGKNKSKGKQ